MVDETSAKHDRSLSAHDIRAGRPNGHAYWLALSLAYIHVDQGLVLPSKQPGI